MNSKKDLATWHPFTPQKSLAPIPRIVSAQGSYLIDSSGEKYIDAISSWWVNLHGHCHPEITSAIEQQAKTLDHCMYAGFEHDRALELSEKLLGLLPENQKKIFYSDNGSTAVEIGLKLAIQSKWNNNKAFGSILVFRGGYHGDTFGAMSLSEKTRFTVPFRGHLFSTLTLPYPTEENADLVLSEFLKTIHTENVSAIIFEPLVQGVAGFVNSSNAVMSKLLGICKKHSILSIADEVMTGFGRTGNLFSSLGFEYFPDIICLAKALTGGSLPLAATTCTQEIYESFLYEKTEKAFNHGHSYTANPIACAAALANLKILLSDSCFEKRELIQKKFSASVSDFKGISCVKDVRHIACILAVEVESPVSEYFSKALPSQNYYLRKGVNLRPLGNVLYTIPPYCMTESELNQILETMLLSLEVPFENLS